MGWVFAGGSSGPWVCVHVVVLWQQAQLIVGTGIGTMCAGVGTGMCSADLCGIEGLAG